MRVNKWEWGLINDNEGSKWEWGSINENEGSKW